MIKWLVYFLISLAFLFFLLGIILMFTVFWLFIGLPFIVLGLIVWLIIWLATKRTLRKMRKAPQRN